MSPTEKPESITADALRGFDPAWERAVAEASPSEAGTKALFAAKPGAQIDVYLGTWCPDSRREVGRFLAALAEGDDLPFEVAYFTLSRTKDRWPRDGRDLRYVPTFIVRRDGIEQGRVVESAPMGIEIALAALLTGEKRGVLSGRTDL